MTSGSLTGELWASIEDVYADILAHPFIEGLTDGSLERDAFRFYVIQDGLYLVDYARALALAAAKAPDPASILVFSRNATQAIEVEQALHETFFAELGVDRAELRSARPAPTNLAYTSYLLAAAYAGSFAEGLGAVLPCFWIYWEVGKALLARGSSDPLFDRWIGTYGGEEYGATVQEVLDLTDRIGRTLGEEERRRVHERFRQTSRYEWMFWDMGYRREAWPI
jgi:thiaminase/transcriptional activator TenA